MDICKRGVALLLFVAGISGLQFSRPALADSTCAGSGSASVGGGYNGFETSAHNGSVCGGNPTPIDGSGSSSVPGTYHTKPVCMGGAMTCDSEGEKKCSDGSPMLYVWFVPVDGPPTAMTINCPDPSPEANPGPTIADVVSAFRRIPLPASRLQVQPPGGETLVNFETNFLTTAEPFERTVTLLDHTVDFAIKAQSFRWTYGDGTSVTGTKPGARYPEMGVTHTYQHRGKVKASVDTTWSARYRINAGAWADVPDTVTISGESVALRVRSATPLVANTR